MPGELSPEQQVVVACVRSALSYPAATLDGLGLDWAAIERLAAQQGLLPLVYAGLQMIDVPVPDTSRATLRAGYLGAVMRTDVWIEPTLRRTLATLGTAGIEPIVLKGAALAYLTYPEPAYRTMSDVDVLLRPEELQAGAQALVAGGYWTAPAEHAAYHHLPPLYCDDGGVGVELHGLLYPEPTPFTIDLEQLRSRSRVAEVAGVQARVLDPTDALLHTCVHFSYAHRYRWFPFRTLTDILSLVDGGAEPLDWALFLDSVAQSRTAGAVYWPLWLAHRWLAAPVPEVVLSRLAPAATVRRLVAAIAEPALLLDEHAGTDHAGDIRRLLLDLSLYAGRTTGEQVALYLESPGRAVRRLREYLQQPTRMRRLAGGAYRLRRAR